MYVCICHAIREKDVARVIEQGETTLAGIYRELNCKPRCGTCLGTMSKILAEKQGEMEPA